MIFRFRILAPLALALFFATPFLLLGQAPAPVKQVVDPVLAPYVIGAVLDITGPTGAPLGTVERNAVLLRVKHINEDGGINGHPIKLIMLDDESDPHKSVDAVKKLIADNVLAIIGPSQTGTTMSCIEAIQAAHIPLVSCAAGNMIVNPVDPYVFKTGQSDILAVARVCDYLKVKGLSDIAVISVTNPYGQSGLDQLKKQAAGAGINIVNEEVFQPADTDMTPQVSKIKKTNAKAVVCWGTNPGPAIVAKNMKAIDLKLPLIMSHGVANTAFIRIGGDAVEGVVFPAGKLLVADSLSDMDPQKWLLQAFRDVYKDAYNADADTFAGHGYDALNIVCNALKVSGPDPEKLRDEIEKTTKYVGISGIFNMSATDHQGLTKDCFAMVTIKDGKWALVE